MKSCDDLLLIEYYRKQVDLQTADKVRAHLEKCSRCRRRMELIVALQNAYRKPSSHRRSRFSIPPSVAAGALLIVALGSLYWLVPLPSPHSPETQVYPAVHLDLRGSGLDSAAQRAAFEAYLQEDFEAAAKRFQALPPDPIHEFFQAVSLYLAGHFAQAEPLLKRLAEGSSEWKWPASWYLAHILQNAGKTHEARRLLERVSENENYFQEQAREKLHREDARNGQ